MIYLGYASKVEARKGKAMSWILTIRNKAGIVSSIGYTHKTAEQIEAIKAKWIAEGVNVIRVKRRG